MERHFSTGVSTIVRLMAADRRAMERGWPAADREATDVAWFSRDPDAAIGSSPCASGEAPAIPWLTRIRSA